MKKIRFMILRRLTQFGLLGLYIGANVFGWTVLQGNLSSSLLFETIPLTDPYAIMQMTLAGAVLGFDVLLGALIITLFYLIIGGRAFCAWVCPVNLITDAANKLRRVLGISQVQKRVYMSRAIRFWILGLGLLLSFVMGVAAFEMISPISMVHRGTVFGMGLGVGAIIVIFLFDLFVHENGWCGHLCPLGAFYSLLGRFSLIRVYHDAEACTACMKCKEVCPEKEVLHMVAKRSESVVMGECTNCGRCIEVCDDDALGFSLKKFATQTKEKSL